MPVIGARAGGVPEIIQHNVDGLLAAPGDTADYLAQLRLLLSSPARAAQLGAEGQRTVGRRFTLERVREQFDRLFHEVT